MQGWNSLVKVYINSRNLHEIPELLQAIPLPNNIPSVIFANRAISMAKIGLKEEALVEFNRGIMRYPYDFILFLSRGEFFANYELYENALADFTTAINLTPYKNRAIIYRGKLFRSLNCYEEALADFSSLIDCYSTIIDKNNDDRIERYNKLVIVTNQRGRTYPYKSLDVAFYERGLTFQEMGRYEDALADCEFAISLDDKNAEPVFARANTFREMGRYEDALADCDRTIKLNRGFAHISQSFKGQILFNIKRYQEAVDALTKSIIAKATCEACWTLLAMTYEKLGVQSDIPRLLREGSLSYINSALVIAC